MQRNKLHVHLINEHMLKKPTYCQNHNEALFEDNNLPWVQHIIDSADACMADEILIGLNIRIPNMLSQFLEFPEYNFMLMAIEQYLKEHYQQTPQINVGLDSVILKDKCDILYKYAKTLATQHPQTDVTIHLYNTSDNTLINPYHLPATVSVLCHQFNGMTFIPSTVALTGTFHPRMPLHKLPRTNDHSPSIASAAAAAAVDSFSAAIRAASDSTACATAAASSEIATRIHDAHCDNTDTNNAAKAATSNLIHDEKSTIKDVIKPIENSTASADTTDNANDETATVTNDSEQAGHDILQTISSLLQLEIWKNKGRGLFSYDLPTGIKTMQGLQSPTIADFANIARKQLAEKSRLRTAMTERFYTMLVDLDQPGITAATCQERLAQYARNELIANADIANSWAMSKTVFSANDLAILCGIIGIVNTPEAIETLVKEKTAIVDVAAAPQTGSRP